MNFPCADEPLSFAPSLPLIYVSCVALIDEDGRILLAQRPAHKPMGGLWEFPGGKLQADETPEAALIRELKEELGIETWSSCLAPGSFVSHRYQDFHLVMFLFLCRKWQGIVRPQEGQMLQWVRIEQMATYPMPAADKPLLAMLRDLL